MRLTALLDRRTPPYLLLDLVRAVVDRLVAPRRCGCGGRLYRTTHCDLCTKPARARR